MSAITRKWDRARFFKFDETLQDFDSMDSSFVRDLLTLDSKGHVDITASNQHALDLIAQQVYGEDELLWVLQEFNRLIDPFSLKPGDRIYYPAMADLEALLFQHSATLNVFPPDAT